MIYLERLAQHLVRDNHQGRSEPVDPVVQDSLHHRLVFFVFDRDSYTVSAEVTLDSQYILSSVC